jgi:GR25 family glycosyltransferase involved in LPS biosynthesis
MRFHLLFLFLLFSCQVLSAGIENFLKKPTNKSVGHTMKNIDFIYMINLDQRPEKFASCIAQLAPYNISPFRFSAVNGWELSLETLNKLGVKFRPSWMQKNLWGTSYLPKYGGAPHHEVMHVKGQNYFCHCMARGTIGIVLSHLSVLKDAYDSGYKTVWVTEDDIQVIQNPHGISDAIEKLDALVGKDGWDILFTDRDTKDQQGNYVPCLSYAPRPNFTPINPNRFATRQQVGPDFKQIGARYGAYSMIVRRSGMKEIYEFIRKNNIFLPYDMEFYLPNNIRMFAVENDIISTQPQALSDNGAPGYLNKPEMLIENK